MADDPSIRGPVPAGLSGPDAVSRLGEIRRLRTENLALLEVCFANATARRQAARLEAQLAEIQGSRAWAVVLKARRFLAAVLPQGSCRARWFAACRRILGDAEIASPERQAGGQSEPSFAVPDPRRRSHRGERSSRRRSRNLKVSVIVPNYNHAPYLKERLRSIFAQTYPPREILFLDDASSDGSVEVAQRMASESPVPFRFLLNESNGGSTFRQWLKGIDQAGGDLIWIAESDDTCRPELLERLVREFRDPEVTLAYCQSAIIGPDGQRLAPDYLASVEDLSPIHWRYPYCVPGHEEVELALSQRNTIPNASAVLFRRPDELEEREDLDSLKLAGDWLFYAMRIQRGKIAYVADSLNGHRHHDRTVRSGFERSVELFEEQLLVKARIFEAFPVTAHAISASIARTFAEYGERTRGLGPRTPVTERPRLRPYLDRLRIAFRARLRPGPDLSILVVVSGVTDDPEQRAAIRRANELAGRFRVFLCNALPGVLDPRAAARLDPRIVHLEGTLGILPWSWDGDPRLDASAQDAMSAPRADVIRELIAFHRIGAVQTSGTWARSLVAGLGMACGGFSDPDVLDDDQTGSDQRRQAERTDRAIWRAGRGA